MKSTIVTQMPSVSTTVTAKPTVVIVMQDMKVMVFTVMNWVSITSCILSLSLSHNELVMKDLNTQVYWQVSVYYLMSKLLCKFILVFFHIEEWQVVGSQLW